MNSLWLINAQKCVKVWHAPFILSEVSLTLRGMETVDKPSELQMELMSLSEPTNTEAPGGKPEEASTDISGENPNEASADILNEKAASTYAETSRGMPAKASAVILGGKPAEDEHILLLNEGTKKTLTAGRVAYYVLCVLIVVAVWSVALLPSVLTFSILRSPVQVIYVQTRVTLNCFTSIACSYPNQPNHETLYVVVYQVT